MAECACCGQTLPLDEPQGMRLRGRKREIFDIVKRAGENGVDANVIFDRVYGDDPNGGPQTGIKIVAVHVWHINQHIKQFGWRIQGGRTGHGVWGTYRVVTLNA